MHVSLDISILRNVRGTGLVDGREAPGGEGGEGSVVRERLKGGDIWQTMMVGV